MKALLEQSAHRAETGPPSRPHSTHRRVLAGLAALKLAVSAVTLGVGFRAVSDDDFSRVVIAQNFALTPKLDPSGTSWLPFPFWIEGGAMMVFGRGLDVATALAVAAGVLSTLATYVAGLWMTRDRTTAALGAAIAAVLPWSARLGVSTVPELPTAALTLLAISSIAQRDATPHGRTLRPLLGGLALFAATLSRYEPWFIAIGFAGFLLFDAIRQRAKPIGTPHRQIVWFAALTALAGPMLWMAWNRHTHGAPLHFLDRVAAYRDAIDHGSLPSRAGGYLLAIGRAEPEFLAVVALSLLHTRIRAKTECSRLLSPFARPFALSLWLVSALTLSSLRGGAPTHHPERALFVVFLLLSLLLAHLIVSFIRDRRSAPSLRTVLVAAFFVGGLAYPVRRWVLQSESFANREAEIALGRTWARLAARGETSLLGVGDYGYFAVQAASGRPEDIMPDHNIDPARPVEPATTAALVERARREGFSYVLGPAGAPSPAGVVARFENGPFVILRVDHPISSRGP